MIDITTLALGTVFYHAVEHNEFFKQKRIFMIDGEGQEWYRNDRDQYRYTVERLTYVGSMARVVTGEITPEEHTDTEYYIKVDSGDIYSYTADEELFENSFLTQVQAEQQNAQWNQARKNSKK